MQIEKYETLLDNLVKLKKKITSIEPDIGIKQVFIDP